MKIPQLLPVCSFPTTVAFVDDDRNLLDVMAFQLKDDFHCETNTSPEESLNFVKTGNQQLTSFVSKLFSRVPGYEDDREPNVNINITAIHEAVYNPARFNTVSVVVVDYAMPKMDGLSYCKQLSGLPIRKIMLTGEADYALAVDAFNKGIIDHFLMKETVSCLEKLREAIKEQQKTYFKIISEPLISCLYSGFGGCLTDPAFIGTFGRICQEKGIVQFYLLEAPGSFLLIDKQNRPFLLIVKSESDMDFLYEIAKEDAPPTVVDAIKHRRKLVYFPNIGDYSKNPLHWSAKWHTASKIEGKQNYYYALVDKPEICGLNVDKMALQKPYKQPCYNNVPQFA